MTRISLTNEQTSGTVEIHAISVKDNFVITISKFNNPKLPNDTSNLSTSLIPLLQGNRIIEVMGYIHSDIEAISLTRSKLISFVSKNSYTYLNYVSFGEIITGYMQGLEIREIPTGRAIPNYLMVIFSLIEGERIID